MIRNLRHVFHQFSTKSDDFLYSLGHNVIRPTYNSDVLPESVLALSLQKDHLSYLHMKSSLEVVRWDCRPVFGDDKPFRPDSAQIQKAVYDIVKILPKADLCLMEDNPIIAAQVTNIPRALSYVQIETTLVTLLNTIYACDRASDDSFDPIVYRLKPSQISRFFKVFVGGQRTQCIPVAQSIIGGSFEGSKGVYVPFHPAETFVQMQNKKSQEQMAYCLLQAVYFYKQLLLQPRSKSDRLRGDSKAEAGLLNVDK